LLLLVVAIYLSKFHMKGSRLWRKSNYSPPTIRNQTGSRLMMLPSMETNTNQPPSPSPKENAMSFMHLQFYLIQFTYVLARINTDSYCTVLFDTVYLRTCSDQYRQLLYSIVVGYR